MKQYSLNSYTNLIAIGERVTLNNHCYVARLDVPTAVNNSLRQTTCVLQANSDSESFYKKLRRKGITHETVFTKFIH